MKNVKKVLRLDAELAEIERQLSNAIAAKDEVLIAKLKDAFGEAIDVRQAAVDDLTEKEKATYVELVEWRRRTK